MELVLSPIAEKVTKETVSFEAVGSLRYFPDGCVELEVSVSSKDGSLKVVNVQVHLKDDRGVLFRSLTKFKVGSDGKVKGLPARRFKSPIAAYEIKRSKSVIVSMSEHSLTGNSW